MRLILSLMIFLGAVTSQAQVDVCITGIEVETENAYFNSNYDLMINGAKIYKANYSCQDIKEISTGIKWAATTFQVSALAMLCVSGPHPAVIAAQAASGALAFIDIYINTWECEDGNVKKEEFDRKLCLALEKQGIECTPPLEHKVL